MSLICLSSRGLSDTPANFSNYFGGRGIQFGKNSEICLVGASIKKQAPSFDIDAPITIPASNNTFAIHYGIVDGADENLFRNDLFVIPPVTLEVATLEEEISRVLKTNCTISPLRYGFKNTAVPTGVNFSNATGLTIKANQWENRREQGGTWEAISNLPFEQDVAIANVALTSTLNNILGGGVALAAGFAQDTRKLWNTDNFATVGSVAASHLQGAKFEITYIAGGDQTRMNDLQGGIVTGNRLQGIHTPTSWINYPLNDEGVIGEGAFYEQKIDLGWSIEGGQLCIYKNTFTNNSYDRDYKVRVLIPVIAGATQIFVLFRPVLNGTNYGWEPLYKIGAAAWIAIRPIAGTEQSGNFPIGYYNGNQRVDVVAEGGLQGGDVGIGLNMVIAWPKTCDAVVVATGAYDNAYVDITALAVATPFPKRLQWGFSPVSDRYATGGTMGIPGGELITNEFRHLLQTRCNSADLFGFYSGGINVATNMITTGIVSDLPLTQWSDIQTPYCIQLPNLPISGYLGGGASSVGGATMTPMIGIVDGFELDDGVRDGASFSAINSISSPYNDNWIKLQNTDSFTVNELQVRITDLYGKIPTDLGTPSHVWIKIRSNRGDISI